MDLAFLIAVAGVLLLFGAISRRAERSPLTPPLAFVGVGLALSPVGLGWLDLSPSNEVIHGLAELTLVLVLFMDAVRIELSCLRREGNLPLRLLAIGLPLTIVLGAAGAVAIFPGLGLAAAFLLAAILAPTDAALGQSVISSPRVPVRIRQALNVESGLNDGIALPIVLMLASLAALNGETNSLAYWLRFVGLQLLGGPLIGLAVGYLGGWLVLRATQSGWMNAPFQRLSGLGLALLAFAGAESVGGNGFIAAFIAGLTLGNTARGVCDSLYQFGEAEGQLLTLLVFLIFGAVMVPAALAHAGAEALVYALLSLTLIRMLPVALSLLGSGLRPASYAFIGWFGPRGLASILFVLVVLEAGRLEAGALLETVVVLTVLLSTLLHGVSAYPLARRYGAHVELTGEAPEHEPVTELPVRVQHSDHASTA